jgi:hypothetical protein
VALIIPSTDEQHIQEVQIVLVHLLCELVEERLAAGLALASAASAAEPPRWRERKGPRRRGREFAAHEAGQ